MLQGFVQARRSRDGRDSHDIRNFRDIIRPWLGYAIFFLLMFSVFLAVFFCKRSGADYIISRLSEVITVKSGQAELIIFPPHVRLSSLSLQDKQGRFPVVHLRQPVLSLGLAGLFPPRCSVTLNAELANGDMHVVVESSSLFNLKPVSVEFALVNAEAETLNIIFPGGRLEKGLVSVKGECDLLAGAPSGSGKALLTLDQADLDLPFPDPSLRFVRDVHGKAEVQWQSDQFGLTSVNFANQALSLTGGGTLSLRHQAVGTSGLDVRFSLHKSPDSPSLPELYPALARLNANQAITLEIGGTLNSPSPRVLQ